MYKFWTIFPKLVYFLVVLLSKWTIT